MNKPIVAVDFDGVIHSYTSGWLGYGNIPDPPIPGAIEWLKSVLPTPESISHFDGERPLRVMIFSSRNKSLFGRRAMRRWFAEHMGKEWLEVLEFPWFKPAASFIIDDRAFQFLGQFPTVEDILAFKPWKAADGFTPAPDQARRDAALAKLDAMAHSVGRGPWRPSPTAYVNATGRSRWKPKNDLLARYVPGFNSEAACQAAIHIMGDQLDDLLFPMEGK